MRADGYIIPHDSKKETGSEDGYLIAQDSDAFFYCVADGVGGWTQSGVNVREFTNQFLNQCSEGFLQGHRNPEMVVEYALNHTMKPGSVTVACGIVEADKEGTINMKGYQIGDSGFLVIRQNKIYLETEEQQHAFNHPFQIGRTKTGSFHGDNPKDGLFYRIPLQKGDVVVFGTDGLLDNMTSEEILDAIVEGCDAKQLANRAYLSSLDTEGVKPFYERAYKANVTDRLIRGGKQDDIGIIVLRV